MKNPKRAQAVIDFIHKLQITTGSHAGAPMVLRDWQQDFIRDIYEPCNEAEQRTVRRAVFSLARKQGKTEISAALALAHLVGPEAVPNGQIVFAANSIVQAANCFDAVRRQIEAQPQLASVVKVLTGTKRIIVKRSDHKGRGSHIRVIAADAGNVLGLSPTLVIYDELTAAKTRDLFDALDTSMGAHDEPLFITISTQNPSGDHVLSQMIDDGLSDADPTTVCKLFAADENCDILDEEQWLKANPALGDFRKKEDLRILAERASRLPSFEASFRNFYLNQRVSPHSGFVSAQEWKSAADPACDLIAGEEIILSLDMSARTDLTSLTAISLTPVARIKNWFWKPTEYIAEHTKKDNFDYLSAVKNGFMFASGPKVINPRDILEFIKTLTEQYNVRALVFDDWAMQSLQADLERVGFNVDKDHADSMKLVSHRQGYKSMTPALQAFETDFLSGNLKHPNNPVLNFCMLNAVATMDPAGGRKLDKSKSTMRIDGAVTLVMACGHRAELRDGHATINPFDEDDDFSLLNL